MCETQLSSVNLTGRETKGKCVKHNSAHWPATDWQGDKGEMCETQLRPLCNLTMGSAELGFTPKKEGERLLGWGVLIRSNTVDLYVGNHTIKNL